MFIGRVCGTVVATIKHHTLESYKLLLVDHLSPAGEVEDRYALALDLVQAGVGDTVLVLEEGNSGRQVTDIPEAPIRSVIVGFVDEVDLGDEGCWWPHK